MNNRKPRGFAYRTGQTDRGFTLIELVIAIVLSGLIAGVVVAALITSLNAADSTTAQVNDSTDTGLVSTFLVRDAQSSGGIDPATAQPVDATLGVSKSDWGGCAQSAALVVRFSWLDHASALARSTIVVTYAYDGSSQTLTRRTCTNGAAGADVVLGRHLKSAVATCHVDNQILDANCTARHPISVSLALTGSGERAPLSATLNAALRTARSQLTITSPAGTSLPTGQVGVAYPPTTVATVGAAVPTTWTASGLPAGLSIDTSGRVSGTPTVSGVFTAIASVTDSMSITVQRAYSLTVNPALSVVWAAALPNGRVAAAYSAPTGTASAGTTPYTWSATGLPPGLSVNTTGGVVGTPTAPGTFPVTIKVTDASGASAQKSYNITIVGRPRYSDVILATPGLGYYWRLGDTPPSTALTNTFGGIDGVYVNGPTLGVAGAPASDPDTAVQFDGVDDYATTPPTIFDNVSIEFWFKSTQGIGTSVLWNEGAGMVTTNINPAKDFGISLRSDGHLVAGVGTNGSADSVVSSSGGYNDGNWHYVVFTRVKSGGATQLYVDAVLVASTTSTSGNPGNGAIPFAFGRIQNPPGRYFAGTLDEVAVYSAVLSQATITSHYNAGL